MNLKYLLNKKKSDRYYMDGLSFIEQDNWEAAYVWIDRAARLGHRGAMAQLGIMRIYGKGVLQNYKDGIRLLEESAALGNDAAQQFLMDLEINGGVKDGESD